MSSSDLLDLLQLHRTAEYHEGRKWLRAAELIRSGAVTGAQVAAAFRVSEPTLWRKVRQWSDHLDSGPGVGR